MNSGGPLDLLSDSWMGTSLTYLLFWEPEPLLSTSREARQVLRDQQFYRFRTSIKIENKMNKVVHVKDDLLCIMDTFWPYPCFAPLRHFLWLVCFEWCIGEKTCVRHIRLPVTSNPNQSCYCFPSLQPTLWCFGVHARKPPLTIIRGQCFCRGHCKLIKQICEK